MLSIRHRRLVARTLFAAIALNPFTLYAQSMTAAPLTAAAVRASRKRSNVAIAQHDTATLVALSSSSYHSVSSRNAHTNGRDDVAAQWREQFATHADVNFVRTPITVRVFTPWQMAEETGAWVGRWTETDGRVVIRGTYTAKWRRIDGTWLLEAEVFTPRSCRGAKYCDMVPPQPK